MPSKKTPEGSSKEGTRIAGKRPRSAATPEKEIEILVEKLKKEQASD